MDFSMQENHSLSWSNVALALSFVAFSMMFSFSFGLGVESSMGVGAFRCVVQLTAVATVLQRVFEAERVWAVASISLLLNLLGTIEIVLNKSQRRHRNMFLSVLLSLLCATIPISILGTRFAMSKEKFWIPVDYIPIVGMLCGSTISGIVVSTSYILKELEENQDKVEIYLALGASRMEACKPIAVEALRLALTPSINRMSVLGIIAIPGMMTGAILGGASVQQAARLQMVITFMESASTSLAAMISTMWALSCVVDREHRVRNERVDNRDHVVWRVVRKVGTGARDVVCGFARKSNSEEDDGEREPLLG
ncbi:hypothetical protein BDN72DRAFT_959366 [Pluteus cervinus]|uniref:Uncharacterized protein n=1 Tax=Pluteus cervinus TaxID=181527 RepID=A0ACD3AV08_9AGAR|nr:hypothetical protein BDN72DRAFT_959366 [Pluteus cervinus]